jgi:uncharacterized UBP type Zn finger protein
MSVLSGDCMSRVLTAKPSAEPYLFAASVLKEGIEGLKNPEHKYTYPPEDAVPSFIKLLTAAQKMDPSTDSKMWVINSVYKRLMGQEMPFFDDPQALEWIDRLLKNLEKFQKDRTACTENTFAELSSFLDAVIAQSHSDARRSMQCTIDDD